MWTLLLKCQGLSVHGSTILQTITQEMTSGEMKFHLRCEELLNSVPEPGFRQLVVEAILVLILCVEHEVVPFLGTIINIDDIVHEANKIFLEEMASIGGLGPDKAEAEAKSDLGLSIHFYDSAPSGPYGTMNYLVRAACNTINTIPSDGTMDCNIM